MAKFLYLPSLKPRLPGCLRREYVCYHPNRAAMALEATAEELTLLLADNKAGYFGVHLNRPGQPKPYQAQVTRGGKQVYLGCFATAEEAALCVARSPEGQAAAAERAAAATPLQPSLPPPPAPPATARRTAPPPRRWRSSPGSPLCHRASTAPDRAWDSRG